MIRVVVADDQALVRSGLEMMLDAQPDISVVGQAEDGRQAVVCVRDLQPDVILMDVRMPGLDGIAATRQIVADGLHARVLVLTTFDEERIVYDALKAGASGFLLKTSPPAKLLEAVRTIADGEALLAPKLTRRLIEDFVRRPPPGETMPEALAALTDRETDVLRLIARGLTNGELAAALYVSEATIKTHITRIFAKLDLRDRAQAVVLAYETGLVQPGDRDG